MREYLKTSLPNVVSVRSIVTVLHKTLSHHISKGEAHDFPELLYIEKGPHNVTIDGTLFEPESGEIIIYAPYAKHASTYPTDATIAIVSFESDTPELASLYNRRIAINTAQQAMLSALITAGVDIFEANRNVNGITGMAPRDGTSAYELQQLKNQLELLLIDILHAENADRKSSSTVNRDNYRSKEFGILTGYLKAHLNEALTLEQISEACTMSVSKLKRLCTEQCGCAPISYLISLRITEAKRMIRETTLNFTQIAETLGFGSVHYFSKQFKDKTCMTPSEYAKSVRKES